MDDNENPYEILGVSSDASPAEIKKAYRRLALKNHPDRQTTEEDRERANSVFAKISNAYEILSDEDLRKKYDRRAKKGKAAPDISSTTNTDEGTCKPKKTKTYKTNTQTTSPQGKPRKTKTTRKTTTKTTSSSSPPSTSRYQSTDGGGSDTAGAPQNFTFSFSSDDFNPEFDDPFEVFQKIFREEYGKEFDPNDVPTSSPIKTNRRKVSSPIKSVKRGNPSPGKAFTKTINLSSPSAAPKPTVYMTSAASPGKKKSPSKMKKEKIVKKKMPKAATMMTGKDDQESNPVVSMSSKTRTILHEDGTQEVITETTNTRADGSVETKTESVRSKGATTGAKKSPKRMQVKRIPATTRTTTIRSTSN